MEAIKQWLDRKGTYLDGCKLYQAHGNDKLLQKLFEQPETEFRRERLRKALQKLLQPKLAKFHQVVANTPPEVKQAIKKQLDELEQKNTATPAAIGELEDQLRHQQESINDLSWEASDLRGDVDNISYDQEELKGELSQLKDDVGDLKIKIKNAPRGWPAPMDETVKALHDEWLPLFTERKNLQARIYDVAVAGQKDAAMKTEAGAMAHRIIDLRQLCRKIYDKRDYYLKYKKLPEEPKLIEIPADKNKWPLTLANWQRYVRDYKVQLNKKPGNERVLKQLARYEWGVAELKKLLGM